MVVTSLSVDQVNPVLEDLFKAGKYSEIISSFSGKSDLSTAEVSYVLQSFATLLKYNDAIAFMEVRRLDTLSNEERVKHNLDLAYLHYLNDDLTSALNLLQNLNSGEALGEVNLELQGLYHNLNGLVLSDIGRLPDAKNQYLICLRICRKLEDKSGAANVYNNLGIVSRKLGDYKEALEYYMLCLDIDDGLENVAGFAETHNNIGVCYDSLGTYNAALAHYHKALDIAMEHDMKILESRVANNLGITYLNMGRIDDAYKFLKKAVEMRKEIGSEVKYLNSLLNYLYVVFDQDEITMVERDILSIFNILKNSELWSDLAESKLALADFHITHERLEEAKDLYNKAKKIVSNHGIETEPGYFEIVEALLLKNEGSISLLVKADEILQRVSKSKKAAYSIRIRALLVHLEILLTELAVINDLEIIEEINSSLESMLEISQKSGIIHLNVDIALIRAQLSLIQGDISGYNEAVNIAKKLVDQNRMSSMESKIAKVKRVFNSSMQFWKDSSIKGYSLRQRLRSTILDEYISEIFLKYR